MDDGRHHAQWRATCRGQRVSPLAPARPAAANAACRLHLDAHRRGPRRHLRRLKNDDAAASITRGEILASPIKLDRADQVLCVGDARRRVVSPCLQPSQKPPPLASAQALHRPAPYWDALRPTSRLIIANQGCGAPSAGSSVESFSPKTCLKRQFAFAIDGAACTAKHWCSEHMAARAHDGRQRPRHTVRYRAPIAHSLRRQRFVRRQRPRSRTNMFLKGQTCTSRYALSAAKFATREVKALVFTA